jgi:hypothetical protein
LCNFKDITPNLTGVHKDLLKLQVSTERRGFTFSLENNLKLHKESFLPVDINLKHLKKTP